VNEPGLIQGRQIGARELAHVRDLLRAHPDWSRRRLSEQLARDWDWRNAAGQLKDMAARTLLLKLEQRGWIALPPRRCTPSNRMRRTVPSATELPAVPPTPLIAPLSALLPLRITEISTQGSRPDDTLFACLLRQHHYLSHSSWVGQNLRYLVRDPHGQPLAALLFGAAAWQCAERDRYIGWDATTRQHHLHRLANNSRFLLVPWLQVPGLASHLLSRIAQRIRADWQAKYGHPLDLLETFVERDRFTGACYRAANWIRVGQTQGRTRQDRPDGTHHQVPRKDIYLYPLHPRFRERLCGIAPQTL
jgi:hypothetical protein